MPAAATCRLTICCWQIFGSVIVFVIVWLIKKSTKGVVCRSPLTLVACWLPTVDCCFATYILCLYVCVCHFEALKLSLSVGVFGALCYTCCCCFDHVLLCKFCIFVGFIIIKNCRTVTFSAATFLALYVCAVACLLGACCSQATVIY